MKITINNNKYETETSQFGHRKLLCNGLVILEPTTDKMALKRIEEEEHLEIKRQIEIQTISN